MTSSSVDGRCSMTLPVRHLTKPTTPMLLGHRHTQLAGRRADPAADRDLRSLRAELPSPGLPGGGGFHGGWVTDDVVGPFKGEPGTSSW